MEFTEHLGCIVEYDPAGELASKVYCPKCKKRMFAVLRPFECEECHYVSPLDEEVLKRVLASGPPKGLSPLRP